MREITTREKAFLSIGALVAVAIFVYFVILPMLQDGGSKQKSSLEEMQERLVAVQKLASMKSMLVDLEEDIGEQSGYKEISFKRGTVSPSMINYIAEAAQQAGIKALEQLDAKPDTSRRKRGERNARQDLLGAIIDRMYMGQVLNEIEQEASNTDDAAEDKPSDERSEEDTPEEPENVESDDQAEEQSGEGNSSPDEGDQVGNETEPDALEEPETAVPAADVEQVASKGTVFPPIPRGEGISDEVKQLLVKSIESRQGKTLGLKGTKGLFNVEMAVQSDLDNGIVSRGLRQEFEDNGILLSNDPLVSKETDVRWSITDGNKTYIIKKRTAGLNIYEQTYDIDEIKKILTEAGLLDEEKTKISKRLLLYSKGVDRKKYEIRWHFGKLGVLKSATSGQQMDIFSIKMVFKGKIDQLVKFMYNLQDSAKWIKVDSMRIGISDRKETLLSIELSMTATALYDI